MVGNKGEEIVRGKATLVTLSNIVDEAISSHVVATDAAGFLDFDDAKETLIPQIIEAAKGRGTVLTEIQAGAAAEDYFSSLYTFTPPAEDKVAEAWIDRSRIFKKYVAPAIGLAVFAGVALTCAKVIPPILNNKKIAGIEKQVEQLYQQRQALNNGIASHKGSDELAPVVTSLARTNDFFTLFCSDGTSADDINADNYKSAKSELSGVESIISHGRKVVDADARLHSAFDTVASIAVADNAKQQAASLLNSGQGYVKAQNFTPLEKEIAGLRELEKTLRLTYTLRIAQGDFLSGVERNTDNVGGTRLYLIVEAVSPSGSLLSMRITNEETRVTKNITHWGQRVDSTVYNAIKNDYTGDGALSSGKKNTPGVIDNDVMAVKKIGYIDLEIVLPGVSAELVNGNQGKITEW